LIVQSPKRLVDLFSKEADSPGIINASYSNFGFIPYGHSMVGRIYFDPNLDNLCSTIPDMEFSFHNNTHERKREITTPFMVADRGGCSFVQKVRNMEDAGVAVAIIVDTEKEGVNDIVMSDDGNGEGIRIPSLLINKEDGDKLIKFLK